ncbi:TPA_asm: hypothetical protein [Ginkgo biloba amalgavirus 1]|nr:TPA_asm: hypothetical protein [Ginkgo biloba amalgavirus 1]
MSNFHPNHGAQGGAAELDQAYPYQANHFDPPPARPREVICELLGVNYPVSDILHRHIGAATIPVSLFMKKMKPLVNAIRSGAAAEYLIAARARNKVPPNGNMTVTQLFGFGQLFSDPEFARGVSLQVKAAKIKRRAPTGANDVQIRSVKLHTLLQQHYAATKDRTRREGEAHIDRLQRELTRTREILDQNLAAVAAEWAPVSVRQQIPQEELGAACWQVALDRGVYDNGTRRSDANISRAVSDFQNEVIEEKLYEFYSHQPNVDALFMLADVQMERFNAQGDGNVARRFLEAINLPDAAALPQLPHLNPLHVDGGEGEREDEGPQLAPANPAAATGAGAHGGGGP